MPGATWEPGEGVHSNLPRNKVNFFQGGNQLCLKLEATNEGLTETERLFFVGATTPVETTLFVDFQGAVDHRHLYQELRDE